MSVILRKLLLAQTILVAAFVPSFYAQASRDRFALEKYDIGKLKIWLVVKKEKGTGYYAYIRDPENFIHHVELGEYIGSRNGKVMSIKPCEIVVSELLPDKKSGWIESSRSLKSDDPDCGKKK